MERRGAYLILVLLAALLMGACGSSPARTTPSPSPSATAPAAFSSAAKLRAHLTASWPDGVQSLQKDVLRLQGATTCDVWVRDANGSMHEEDGTKSRSQVLFAVYGQHPAAQALVKADKRVHWNSSYGSPLYRLSAGNWAIWSAYRPALVSFRRELGGELLQLYEGEKPVMRDVRRGERIALQCGLALTVPAGYKGYYTAGMSELTSTLDSVCSREPSQNGLMYSFMAQTMTLSGDRTLTGFRRQPLIAISGDLTVEVRSFFTEHFGGKPMAMTYVFIHLPGRPPGRVALSAFGKQASDDPDVVMEQLRSMWRLFDVQGAELPSRG